MPNRDSYLVLKLVLSLCHSWASPGSCFKTVGFIRVSVVCGVPVPAVRSWNASVPLSLTASFPSVWQQALSVPHNLAQHRPGASPSGSLSPESVLSALPSRAISSKLITQPPCHPNQRFFYLFLLHGFSSMRCTGQMWLSSALCGFDIFGWNIPYPWALEICSFQAPGCGQVWIFKIGISFCIADWPEVH